MKVADYKVDAMARWRIGHHGFFLLIQGIVAALLRFESAIKVNDLEAAGSALEKATSLMWGSAAALHFAGDFVGEDYDQIVRVAMSPPNVSDGFSGLLSLDHACMINVLKRLKPVFEKLPATLKHQHEKLLWAMAAAYDSHKFVCSKFKGGEMPSLRMSKESSKTSVEVLETFKKNRMQLAGSGAHQ